MTRRTFLGSIAAPLLAAERPNIVLITIDDLGWTDLSCFGSRYYETPNVDRLASQGVRFTNAYAACAVCSPTRAAIQTGRYPARLGVTDWIRARFQGGAIPEDKRNPRGYESSPIGKLLCPKNALWMERDEITLAEALKPAGYTSCHIGKWHLGADDWYPEKQGYDFNYGGCDLGQPPRYFDPYGIPTLADRKAGEYLTDREGDEAASFLRRFRDKPFFLNFCPYAVHTPLQAKKDLLAKYDRKARTNQTNATYAAMIESMDDAVGKIVRTLDELRLTDRTLLVFTSDNGGLLQSTSNAPLRSGKGYPYEGGVRVPQIVRWPGVVRAGSETGAAVSSIDLFPTLLEATGAASPKDRSIDGISLTPLLRGGKLPARDLFWHFPHYRQPDVIPYSIVRSGDWKLIRRYEGKRFELFDLASDGSETKDLSAEKPELVRDLDGKLSAWLKDVGARLPKT